MPKPKNKRPPPSQLRIIGGQWRSRKLAFTPAPGLRPTTDRVRETLFNWLAPVIHGAKCVDLFAGSGALGLEALSRGAARCSFVDTSAAALNQISQHLATLDATANARCHRQSAAQFLAGNHQALDIVFIDPPFGLGLVAPTCELLATSSILSTGASIYLETPRGEAPPAVPDGWKLHREKSAGDVVYRLYHCQEPGSHTTG